MLALVFDFRNKFSHFEYAEDGFQLKLDIIEHPIVLHKIWPTQIYIILFIEMTLPTVLSESKEAEYFALMLYNTYICCKLYTMYDG